MTRRSPLAVTLVALLAVGGSIVTTTPRGSALAADPEAQLAETQAQLADAQAAQHNLEQLLAEQRAQLSQLETRSTELSAALDVARAELAEVTAEYHRVSGLLAQVREQVADVMARIAELHAQIDELDAQLGRLARDIEERTVELQGREELLEEHLRAAYARSRTSVLEVLLSASSLDAATTEVGYLLTVSEQDRDLAEQIRAIREELDIRRETLWEGRRALNETKSVAREEQKVLEARQEELAALEIQLAELQVLAEQKEAEQASALNAALEAKGDVERHIVENQRAFEAQQALVGQLQQQAAQYQAAIEEARRRAEEEARRAAEEAARRAAEAAARNQPPPAPARPPISSFGFIWPEASFVVTQEWGPTGFALEPPYTYRGTYYPHFHGGIDIANGCGTPLMAAGPGVVIASGQPLAPWDSGFGVVIDHGGGVQSWYWHLTTQVVASPGQIVTPGTVIGYEGNTGFSTGCHLHFAINDNGVWENPRYYLP